LTNNSSTASTSNQLESLQLVARRRRRRRCTVAAMMDHLFRFRDKRREPKIRFGGYYYIPIYNT
jgi:hypothetical protein